MQTILVFFAIASNLHFFNALIIFEDERFKPNIVLTKLDLKEIFLCLNCGVEFFAPEIFTVHSSKPVL